MSIPQELVVDPELFAVAQLNRREGFKDSRSFFANLPLSVHLYALDALDEYILDSVLIPST